VIDPVQDQLRQGVQAGREGVQTWKLDTNVEGRAEQQIKASEAGQYRLSYKVTDSKKHTIGRRLRFSWCVARASTAASSASTTSS